MNTLQIQIPTTLRYVVGVADAITELWTTTADFTSFCHRKHTPAQQEPSK
jgi:hypothetical protein